MINFLFEREKYTLLILPKESSDDMNVAQVPIVCEFSEVLPEEVTSLSPEREVEFSIYLVPGNAPISIAPYCMTLVGLRELKNQLE